MTTIELKQERQAFIEEARTILDTVDAEKRSLNEAEKTKYEGINSKIDELTDTISKREKLEKFETIDVRDLPKTASVVSKPESDTDKEYREFGEAIKERRDYTSTMNSGVFQKSEIESKIREGLPVLSMIRAQANVTQVASNVTIAVDAGDVSVGIVGEGGTYGAGDGTFTPVEFKPLKVGAIIKYTDEALTDMPLNIAQNSIVQTYKAMAKKENEWFMVGNGTTEPEGILTGASQGIVTASASAITGKELNGLLTSLDSSLLPYASMFGASSTLSYLMDLTDKNKGYTIVWDSAAKVYRVNGIPFYINNSMPVMGTGNKVLVIGDVQNFYEIKDRTGFEVKILDQLYAESGKIGHRFTFRTDAHVMDSQAFKYLQMA
jgi:HK97 family phage major capsid protein